MTENETQAVRLLVVSREATVLRPLWSIGEANSWQLETAGSGWEALERLQSGMPPSLLVLDVPQGSGDGLHALRWLHRVRPNVPIVLISGSEDPEQRKDAIRLGAQEYLVGPVTEREFEMAIRSHLPSADESMEVAFVSEDVEQIGDEAYFVGGSSVMRKLRAQAELLAASNVAALIFGESGSGKDTAAQLIHKLSVRSEFKFLKVNCGALPDDLLAAELFGIERVGGSGLARSKPGKLELCDKGTILLNDIEEISDSVQCELVRVLQNKHFYRPSGGARVDLDVRILAATSTNIEQALSEGKLREDFYYCLSAFTIHVPPLRQRKDELPLLLRHFMQHQAKHYGLQPRTFSPSVISACQQYAWPGNLKELGSFVKRYLVMADSELEPSTPRIDSEDLSSNFTPPQASGDVTAAFTERSVEPPSGSRSLRTVIQNLKWETERNAISTALEKTGWNRKEAARLLKISYRTILYKIEQYHMSSEAYTTSFMTNGTKGNGNTLKGNHRSK